MSAGFLTMTDRKYLALAKVLRDSLLLFARYPLQVRTDCCDGMREVHGRVQVKPFQKRYGLPMAGCFLKYAACLESPFEHTVWVDADCVANKHVDELVEFARGYDQKEPIMCFHAGPYPYTEQCERALGSCQLARSYNHACVIVFNRSCRPFFRACIEAYQKVKDVPGINDEILLNVMLRRSGSPNRLNCVALPCGLFQEYMQGDAQALDYWAWTAGGFASTHFVHGEKRASRAQDTLDTLCAILRERALNRRPCIL